MNNLQRFPPPRGDQNTPPISCWQPPSEPRPLQRGPNQAHQTRGRSGGAGRTRNGPGTGSLLVGGGDLRLRCFRGAAVSTVSPVKTSSRSLQSRALVAGATRANTHADADAELSLSPPSAVVLSSRFNGTNVSVPLLTHTSVGARGRPRPRSKVKGPPGSVRPAAQLVSERLRPCFTVLLRTTTPEPAAP